MALINFSKFNIKGSDSDIYSKIHISTPKKTLKRFGKLGLIINSELPQNKDSKQEIKDKFQELIDLAVNKFYNNKKSGANQEKEFEKLLQQINNWLQSKKKILNKLKDFNVTVINAREEKLIFSQIGDIGIYLQSSSPKLTEISQKNKDKKFSDIVNGALKKDNKLLITSKNIFDHFSFKKITQLIKKNSPEKAIEKIKDLLPESAKNENFIGGILKLTNSTNSSNKKDKPKKDKSKEEKEEKTKEKVKNKDKKKLKKDNQKEPKKTKEKDKNKSSKKGDKKKDKKGKKSKKEDKKDDKENKEDNNPKQKKTKPSSIKPSEKSSNNKINPKKIEKMSKRKFKKTKKSHLIALIVVILFAGLFTVSMIIVSNKRTAQKEQKQYTTLVNKIENKKAELTSALIAEESNVKIKLSEMKDLLEQLPKDSEKHKQVYNDYYSSYKSAFNKLYNITSIKSPRILTNLTDVNKKINTKDLAKIGNNLYILSAKNNYIYRYNLENNTPTVVNETSKNVSLLNEITKLDSDNLLGENNNNLASFNIVDKKLEPLTIQSEHEQKIKDVIAYNNRIYTLEPNNNQIYKYSRSIEGFSKEESWIQDDTSIENALSIAIDGSIYVLLKGGNIIKLYTGKKTEFNNPEFNPPISLDTKIATNYDLNYLYLLDPSSKRLIKISKQGNIKKQYTSPQFGEVKDFIISENENKAWILSGSKIFEIDL